MLNKKTLVAGVLSFIFLCSFTHVTQAADSDKTATKNTLTLEVSAPDPMPNLQPNEKPNPVFLQFTSNDGSVPIYSDAVYPGDSKTVALKITAASSNGGQIQFVANNAGTIQSMSFVHAFSGERLSCLVNKNAKIQVQYNINNKLLDVRGIPANC